MSRDEARPNIVFILADDLAVWGLGSYGNSEIKTPHLDSLADDGMRFTNFFCTSPVCSPSRASLLTGKMPSQHGVQDWIRGGNGTTDAGIDYLESHRSYTEILAEAGYVCGISGKWHLGDSLTPQKGFSHWFVHESGGSRYHDVPMIRDGRRVEAEGYLSDVITDDAIEFMSTQVKSGTPFYLSAHFTAPHSPWVDQHPRKHVELYDDCAFESCPQEPRHPWVKSHPIEMNFTEKEADPARGKVTVRDQLQGYFAAVTALDECVGRIRQALCDLEVEDKTLLVFTSDNGFNLGHHGIWGKGNATFPQNMYDSSVKVPLIVTMPGRVAAGAVSAEMLSGYDIMPTLLELVGVPGDETSDHLPGKSFSSVLLGGDAAVPGDREVIVYDEFGPTRMIRTTDWKYVHRYPYGPHELFDLANDPGERVNLLQDERVWSSDEPDRHHVAEELRQRLEVWFKRFTDPEMDGRVQAVTGRGQMDLVTSDSVSFHPMESEKQLDADIPDRRPRSSGPGATSASSGRST